MAKRINKPSEAALLKLLEIQWQDHFQTRRQTWEALRISALIAVTLVGVDWKINQPIITIVCAVLLALVALFGMQITIRHRNSVEVLKFEIIKSIEDKLMPSGSNIALPKPIHWWYVFIFWKSNSSLFILRMQFVILIVAISFLIIRLPIILLLLAI